MIPQGVKEIEVFCVGGGGGYNGGGGGGGGYTKTEKLSVKQDYLVNINIGIGGSVQTSSGNTSVESIVSNRDQFGKVVKQFNSSGPDDSGFFSISTENRK